MISMILSVFIPVYDRVDNRKGKPFARQKQHLTDQHGPKPDEQVIRPDKKSRPNARGSFLRS
jgi:hypothetical protein